MTAVNGDGYSRQGNSFRPENPSPAGYARIIDAYRLAVPRPVRVAGIAGRHRPKDLGTLLLLTERYAPSDSLADQVTFALKWEGIDLAVLDALFRAIPATDVADAVRSAPTGSYMRRLWFLYEWLTGHVLDLPDLGKVKAVPVVNEALQLALAKGEVSSRHRVRNNLPGTPAFCPMVRRTPSIAAFQGSDLGGEARRIMGRTRADVLARAAAFLLLSDSRASYRIEGEKPSPDRLRRWGEAIQRAGNVGLSVAELEALQRQVVGDDRFVHIGLRQDGGFVGEHDRHTQAPLPDHVSARPEDLPSLVEGIIAFDERAGRGAMDAIAAAAVVAFGFAYVHPFEDGNGRIHRWLIHHVLAAAGFAEPGLVFPVSAVMLREIGNYRKVLESYSRRLLPLIAWEPTAQNNVRVLNETVSWYRFFDATAHVEFLFQCVETTVRRDLPYEVAFLTAHDRFTEGLSEIVDMPTNTVSLLHSFLRQGDGRLSKRAREGEFQALTDAEVQQIESLYEESVTARPTNRLRGSGPQVVRKKTMDRPCASVLETSRALAERLHMSTT